MCDNKRIGLHISALIDVLTEEIASLKPDEYDKFDLSDIYDDIYNLHIMQVKYCPEEESA